MDFKNKKILIIMPFFFEYQNIISDYLRIKGADVYLINENIKNENIFNRLYIDLNTKLKKEINIEFFIKKYYLNKLHDISELDYVLIIKGSTINNCIIDDIKQRFPTSKWIMYQWDTVINHYHHALDICDRFDKILSFDMIDCDTYGWNYRPLFFSTKNQKSIELVYDITYVCSFHSERYKVLLKIKDYIKKNKDVVFFDYLYTSKINYYRLKFFNRFIFKKNNFKYKILSNRQINDIYSKSKCIVDYAFPKQNGLTMRTIESIGHKCKLITNNKNVLNADFYDPQNVYVYDLDNFDIPKDFIKSPYKELNREIYYKYSLDGWIEDIFEFNDESEI